MTVFGIGFRIVLIALAVIIERVGAYLRGNGLVAALREIPLVRSLLASPPPDLEARLTDDR